MNMIAPAVISLYQSTHANFPSMDQRMLIFKKKSGQHQNPRKYDDLVEKLILS